MIHIILDLQVNILSYLTAACADHARTTEDLGNMRDVRARRGWGNKGLPLYRGQADQLSGSQPKVGRDAGKGDCVFVGVRARMRGYNGGEEFSWSKVCLDLGRA